MEAAARRELLEETGYEAGRMERLFEGVSSAGLSDEKMTFFRATDLRKTDLGGGDASEEIVVHEVPADRLPAWLTERAARGVLIDLKVYSALPFCESDLKDE